MESLNVLISVIIIIAYMDAARAECGTSCSCTMTENDMKVTCTGNNITKVPGNLPFNTTKLYLSGTNIRIVGIGAFSAYPFIKELFFRDTPSEPCQVEYLEPGVFDGLTRLEALGMIGCGRLTSLSAGVLGTFQNLETLHIYRSGLTVVPDLSLFRTVNPDMEGVMKEIDLHSNKIEQIHAYDFSGVRTDTLKLEDNKISRIDSHSFKNATIVTLLLNKNEDLYEIGDRAFDGAALIHKLDLSYTKIQTLPTKGLNKLRHLVLKDTPSLKHFPSVLEFTKIERAELTYPHHCCAFKNPEKQNPTAWRAKQAQERINRECAMTTAPMPTVVSGSGSSLQPIKKPPRQSRDADFSNSHLSRVKRNFGGFGEPLDLSILNDSDHHAEQENVNPGFGPLIHNNPFGKFGESNNHQSQNSGPGMNFHKSTVPVDENITQNVFCGELYVYNRNVTCTPEPDALNPCEDVMGYVWLRVIVWFVLLAALLGNSVVLVVLITGRSKFTVPKFLMCNLAFADLLMGVYLLLLASIDIHTLGEYFNYAVQWQNEGGCQAAGFLSVFSSELSIFTLTILTLERWYAISHAIHLNKRLKLRQSMALMFLGYTFASILGLLPLVGISGYGNVSICLPMKAEDGVDIGYVVSLLVMNGVMFLAICFCYVNMYWKVKGSATTARSNDATIAKRMALLVFTNFVCWAPIAFFGLTASAGLPLIDITNSKILLVFFYPLNSCANPFLYAILTKQFRKDVFILLGKYGICVEKANMYRGTYTSRSMSQSRGNKDHVIHVHHRNSESVFSHITDTNHVSKYSANVPKVHPCHRQSPEVQPFIEKSHIDRAVEFANKEPVLIDDSALDVWGPGTSLTDRDQLAYVRSVSYYTQLDARKVSGSKSQSSNICRLRNSVETFFSNSTDTTLLSDNLNISEDIWKIREVEHIHNNAKDDQTESDDDDRETHNKSIVNTLNSKHDDPSVCNARNDDCHSLHTNCYIIASDFDNTDVYRKLVSEDFEANDQELNASDSSIKRVNSSEELRTKLVRSPSLSSLDETMETCFATHNQLNTSLDGCHNDNIDIFHANIGLKLDNSKESGFYSGVSLEAGI